MDRQQADALVAELAATLGIPELALDERGVATLGVGDEQVIVSLGYNAQAGTIDLMVCLDEIAPTSDQLITVLEANFGWLATQGAAFACVPGGGALVLQSRCTSEQLHTRGLALQVQRLAELAQFWTSRLLEGNGTSAPAGELGYLEVEGIELVRI